MENTMRDSILSNRLNDLFANWEAQLPAIVVKDLVSFKPTCHVLNIASGVRVFVCCAVDTLLIVQQAIQRMSTRPNELSRLEPGSTALSFLVCAARFHKAHWVPQILSNFLVAKWATSLQSYYFSKRRF
jgi:hypothetical protein